MEIGALCVQLVGMPVVAECVASVSAQAKAALRADPAELAASLVTALASFRLGFRLSPRPGEGAIHIKQGER
jgi:hypothetical protein